MYTEEQFIELEQEERTLTTEATLFMLYLLAETKSEIEKELRSFYQKYGKDGVVTLQQARKWVSDKDHRRRITALLLILTDEFDKLHSKMNPEFNDFLTKVILLGSLKQSKGLRSTGKTSMRAHFFTLFYNPQ